MCQAIVRLFVLSPLVAAVIVLASSAGDQKADEPKPIEFPKDAKAVVLSYDPGAGGFIRKGEPPYLKIQADGSVTVTNLHDGAKKEAKLTPKQLDDLLRFVIHDKKFFEVTEAKMNDAVKEASAKGPFIAIGGAGTAKITVEAAGKKHAVSFRAADVYLRTYPKVEVLPLFVAVEKRLADYATSVAKEK
ncbi:MAG: hypothetical protein HY289_01980 [Planctomycetes bacterium]|nr:hypothetical protein [Planctomycetota bacterium]